MYQINEEIRQYIETNIFPEYDKNEEGHGITHIKDVIRRSFDIIKQNELDVNHNIVYVIAAYHDIGHHIDAENHEKISAEIMSKDKNLKQFFSNEELILIKEAIEDHRASSKNEPRTIYGKIVSSADRNNTVEQCLERTYSYGKRHNPKATNREIYEDSFEKLTKKFGINGYAKYYFRDNEYEEFLKNIRYLLEDKEKFCKTQDNYIKNR